MLVLVLMDAKGKIYSKTMHVQNLKNSKENLNQQVKTLQRQIKFANSKIEKLEGDVSIKDFIIENVIQIYPESNKPFIKHLMCRTSRTRFLPRTKTEHHHINL